jgi:medium-chain acyl-[acyl-carrier-protein] hydrolase
MMPDPDSIHTKNADIAYSALGSQGQFKIVSILNFLQDVATEHASAMGVSGFDLARKNLAWVISRYQIEIKATPKWRDEIWIETWRTPVKNLYELRHFRIIDSTAREIITARAFWVMVKKETGRPVRLSRFLSERFLEKSTPSDTEIFQNPKGPGRVDFELPFKIRMHDLDLNHHVNNAIYVEWAVETVPESLFLNYRPETINVTFHRESVYGDAIISRTQILETREGPQTLHSILRKEGTVELARINISWRPQN